MCLQIHTLRLIFPAFKRTKKPPYIPTFFLLYGCELHSVTTYFTQNQRC